MKYLVFVDFDGVLCSNRVHFGQPEDSYMMWSRFDPVVMEFFNKIHTTFDDVYFVWTTTWRNSVTTPDDTSLEHIVYSMWYNAGFRGFFGKPWMVNPDRLLPQHKRAEEIKNYLEVFAPTCQDYLILDDSDYGFNDVLSKKRFIKTDSDNGMLFKHMKDAWSLMGNWDRK